MENDAADTIATRNDELALEHEIAKLESQLADAKKRLTARKQSAAPAHPEKAQHVPSTPSPAATIPDPSQHYLLLLSDSALPLGSFAFSSGLESYLAHTRQSPSTKPSFASFLPLSLSSYASTSLPFTLAAHRDPTALASLDDTLDATMICTVGRRASTAQGRALLSIWEKSLAPPTATSALTAYSAALRRKTADPPLVSAHLPPLFGAVARLLGLSLSQTASVFLLSHAKALVSAAVRAGLFGPYQAQRILAGEDLQALIADLVRREWDVPVEKAGQTVPVMDLWIGRHEVLYSRIFNS
ncbi:UreF-domain-containing protein [Xylaria nigripes]|nr:UreF-domain-containing protein [Xylaria nigripes]